jgi:hypothetical protein
MEDQKEEDARKEKGQEEEQVVLKAYGNIF